MSQTATRRHGTGIGWTHIPGFKGETWNPTTGCDRVTPGCAYCYAAELAARLKRLGQPRYQRDGGRASGPGFGLTLHEDRLEQPLRWAKRRAVFVNSMSDLFHDEVPARFIAEVFAVMSIADRHVFMILTKRPRRMREVLTDPMFWVLVNVRRHRRGFPLLGGHDGVRTQALMRSAQRSASGEFTLRNVWLGTTIENRRAVGRADDLRATPAAIRFVSAEPLLGPLLPDADHMIDAEHETYDLGDFPIHAWRPWADGYQGPGLNLEEIDWLIAGGESGPHFNQPEHRGRFLVDEHGQPREDRVGWVRDLQNYCEEWPWQGAREGETAFFFKQWGGRTPRSGGRLLDGRTWDEFPVHSRDAE